MPAYGAQYLECLNAQIFYLLLFQFFCHSAYRPQHWTGDPLVVGAHVSHQVLLKDGPEIAA